MLSPLRLLAGLIVLAWLGHRILPRWLHGGLVFVCACLLLLTTPLCANALIRWQEARVADADICRAPVQSIVLLASGVSSPPESESDFAALDATSVRRLFTAVDLYRSQHVPLAIVGSSGYAIADSRVLASLAMSLGVAASDLREETTSLTTRENARALALMQPPVQRNIALVTSRVHMPRAMRTFRRAGFDACAEPARSEYHRFDGIGYLLPAESAAIKTEEVLHEWVGEIVYGLKP